jgi:hypothetical protein
MQCRADREPMTVRLSYRSTLFTFSNDLLP